MTMSDLDGQRVVTSSESRTRRAVRLICDSGLPAPGWRDQAHASRAQPRSHEMALQDGAARRRTTWPPSGGHEHEALEATMQVNRERNAPVENDDLPAS